MTAQISDSFAYRGRTYAIAGKKGSDLFDPKKHGLKPAGRSSAFWRGSVCSYALDHDLLVLDQVEISLMPPVPTLLGHEPSTTNRRSLMFNTTYKNLCEPIDYTGGLLIGSNFIKELYVHMGFHRAWKYKTVHELIFEAGRLVEQFDRSEQMTRIRQEMRNKPLKPSADAGPPEIERWVENCFSLEYR